MKIVLLLRESEELLMRHQNFLCGRFSFIANESGLFCEKSESETRCDICIISAQNANEKLAPAIYRAAKSKGSSSVFIDSTEPLPELERELSRLGANVFTSLFPHASSPHSSPVAELSSSGGDICEYLGVTPAEFFDDGNNTPPKHQELINDLEALDPENLKNVIAIIKGLKK